MTYETSYFLLKIFHISLHFSYFNVQRAPTFLQLFHEESLESLHGGMKVVFGKTNQSENMFHQTKVQIRLRACLAV